MEQLDTITSVNTESIVFKLLDRNFNIYAGNGFIEIKPIDESFASSDTINFNSLIKLLFGVSDEIISTSNKWFLNKKEEFLSELFEEFNKINLTIGTVIILPYIKKLNNYKYSEQFLENIFFDYYKERFLNDKLENILNFVDLTLGSKNLEKELESSQCSIETSNITDYCRKYANDYYFNNYLTPKLNEYVKNYVDTTPNYFISGFIYNKNLENHHQCGAINKWLMNWYSENVVKPKFDKLTTEFNLTLNHDGWTTTWIGHGVLTEIKLQSYFGLASTTQNNYLSKLYDEWLDDKKIETLGN